MQTAIGSPGPPCPTHGGPKSSTMELDRVVLVLLLTTLPVNLCGKGKLVTLKLLVMGAKWPPGLESLYRYFATRFCTKSPFWKFNTAVMAPVAELKSPGTLRLVTPPITEFTPSCSVNCWTNVSAPPM